MTQSWIIDVLTDLRRFAEGNDMSALAQQLRAAEQVADLELKRLGDTAQLKGTTGGTTTEQISRGSACRFDA